MRTKAEIKELSQEVSKKVLTLSQLKKEKKREIEEDDFVDVEDKKILKAYTSAEKEAIELANDIKEYLANYGKDLDTVQKIRDKYSGIKDQSTAPTPGTSSMTVKSSSLKAKAQASKHKCPTCDKLFHKDWIEKHKKQCGKMREMREKFKCSKCQSSFLTKSYLQTHINTCTGIDAKSKVCPKCNKGMDTLLSMPV